MSADPGIPLQHIPQDPPPATEPVAPGRWVNRLFQADRRSWQQNYSLLLLALDVTVLAVVFSASVAWRVGTSSTKQGFPYPVAALGVGAVWLAALAFARSYETGFVLRQAHEVLVVVRASASAFAVTCLINFLGKVEVSRGLVLSVFPAGLLGLLVVRLLAHRLLRQARRAGWAQRRTLLVGDAAAVRGLADAFDSEPEHGHRIVAACIAEGNSRPLLAPDVRVTLGLSDVAEAVRQSSADTVAIAAGHAIDETTLRRISYSLEGMGIELMVAPSLADVSGTRISVRPVAGLPLLHLDEPELDGVHKVLKGAFDRTAAALGLLALFPVLGTLYVLVRMTSSGPGFFRHQRIGRDGQPFGVWKFRSMYSDAASRQAELMKEHAHAGPLFKLKNDPRVTPIGRLIRKWSLDELPQLINVLTGDMSLVGPRPQVQAEVDLYEGRAHRRLLVKPGITGLWQVSGRSDLAWEQAVRLDLQYVEGWSLGMDLAILGRTVSAVMKSSGAY